jgi:site-specific recombinase XerD
MTTGSVGKARSDPAAIISFKRSDCKAAVAEAYKQVWRLNRNQQAMQTERKQPLLDAPDPESMKGKRDLALLAILVACGLRRH